MVNKQEKLEDLCRELLLKNAFLSNQVNALETSLSQQNSTISELQEKLSSYRSQISWFRTQMFGQKTEKLKDIPVDEPLLPGFDSGEEEVIEEDTSKEESEQEKKGNKKRRKRNKGKCTLKLPDNLEVKETIHELPEDERIDSETGEELVEFDREVVEKLACNPAKYYIDRHVYVKYAVKNSSPARMIQLPAPESILRGSKFDESFMAEVVTAKLAYHLPFYRQQEMLECLKIGIERQTLSSLFVNLGEKMEVLYEEMKKAAFECGYLYTDDTPARMLQPGKGKTKEVRMWVYETANPDAPPYRLYDFTVNRSYDHPFKFLKDFEGIIHGDAFGAYVKLDKDQETPVKWASCWVHARRYFYKAADGDPELKKYILKAMRNLYRYEKVAWNRNTDGRLKIRNKYEKPIVDEIFNKLWSKIKTERLVPSEKQTEAIKYMLNHEKNFKYYLNDSAIHMDNNAAERSVRKIVLGRKNWMFVGSPKAGNSMAILYSFVQTCRALKIDPQAYLEDVFRRLLSHPHKNLRELLPDRWAKQKALKNNFSNRFYNGSN